MKSRKGYFTMIFAPLIVIFLLITLLTAFIMLSEKYKILDNYPVGKKQFDYISSVYITGFYHEYVQQSAEEAVIDAINSLANNGGYFSESDCGKYYGVQIWYDGKECYPNYKNNFESMVNMKISERLLKYPIEVYFDNYQLSFIDKKIIGTALESPFLNVKTIETIEETKARKKEELKLPEAIGVTPGVSVKPLDITPALNVKVPKYDYKKIYEKYKTYAKASEIVYGVEAPVILSLLTIESGGNNLAVSKSKADCVGLGQFCYKTAYEIFDEKRFNTPCYINKCDPSNDVRTDPEKSIMAIGKYLKILIRQFDESYTYRIYFALAAYNGGAAGVKRALKDAKNDGKDNPSWEELLPYLRKYKSESNFIENSQYPVKVMHYYPLYKELFKEDR